MSVSEKNKVSAIIAAAGNASRLGYKKSKLFLRINEKPLLYYSLEKFLGIDEVSEIIVVTNDVKETEDIVNEFNLVDNAKQIDIKVVSGGNSRKESVYNGFRNVSSKIPLVLVHDVGRPLFDIDDAKICIQKASEFGASILAVPVVDTIKLSKLNNDNFFVEKTLDRTHLFQIQTPQVYKYELLKDAYEKYISESDVVTDESMMVEGINKPVYIVSSKRKNIKITYPEDIDIANAFLRN